MKTADSRRTMTG